MGASDQELTGRVAIVTGAGAGIDAGIAAMLAEAGTAVTVADIDGEGAASTAKAIEKRGRRVITVTADVSETREIDAPVRQTVTDLGGVDILVNNAGIARVPRAAGPSSLSYDSNVVVVPQPHDGAGRGPGRREVARRPRREPHRPLPVLQGRIAPHAPKALRPHRQCRVRCGQADQFYGAASYTASKAGLLGFTRHLAYEVAPHGINVNAICPARRMTPMYERNADEETRRERIVLVPKGRWAHPRGPWTAVFLCS